MKKQIPTLFSTVMVQANMAGRKTNTRRTTGLDDINNAPDEWLFDHFEVNVKGGLNAVFSNRENAQYFSSVPSPYGKPGDILWVREGYYQYGKWGYGDGLTKGGKTKRKFIPLDEDIAFEKTTTVMGETFHLEMGDRSSVLPGWFQRLPRFMPKKYARIWLEVTDIRVERLHDISEEDAIAEGVELNFMADLDCTGEIRQGSSIAGWAAFMELWESINGADSWEANPWIWVVSYKVLSTTGKPAGLEKEATNG